MIISERHIGFLSLRVYGKIDLFITCIDTFSPISTCRKSKRCSKSPNHRGKCNSEKQSHKFWERSPIYNLKANQGEVIKKTEEIHSKEANLIEADLHLSLKRQELEDLAKYSEEQTSRASK